MIAPSLVMLRLTTIVLGVTLSPRSTTRHSEPSHDEKIDCQITSHEGVVNGVVHRHGHDIFAVNGYCKDINKKSGRSEKRHGGSEPGGNNTGDGIIDFDSTQQSFIFALGPTDRHLHSNDKDAQIKRHSMFGHFQIDITKSTVQTTSDVSHDELSSIATWENHGAQLIGKVTKDRDWGGNIHSLLMCTAYVLMFPVGVVFLRLLEKVRWHWWMQVVGVGFVLLGLGLGIWAALEYNHVGYTPCLGAFVDPELTCGIDQTLQLRTPAHRLFCCWRYFSAARPRLHPSPSLQEKAAQYHIWPHACILGTRRYERGHCERLRRV